MHQSLDDKSAYSVCSLTIKFNISYTLVAVKMLLYSTNFKEVYIYIYKQRKSKNKTGVFHERNFKILDWWEKFWLCSWSNYSTTWNRIDLLEKGNLRKLHFSTLRVCKCKPPNKGTSIRIISISNINKTLFTKNLNKLEIQFAERKRKKHLRK